MIKNKEWIMEEIKQHLWETEGESYTGYEAGIDFVKALIEEADQQLDEKMTEIKKVVIPQFVADVMSDYSDLRDMLTEEYYSNSTEEIDNDAVQCWIDGNFETLCKAWLDGYEVEEVEGVDNDS